MQACRPVDSSRAGITSPPTPPALLPGVQATPHGRCRVRVTVLRRGNSTSSEAGHKFKLAGAMVLPAGTNEFSASDRLAVVVPQMFGGG